MELYRWFQQILDILKVDLRSELGINFLVSQVVMAPAVVDYLANAISKSAYDNVVGTWHNIRVVSDVNVPPNFILVKGAHDQMVVIKIDSSETKGDVS
jgi:hypothetical protein